MSKYLTRSFLIIKTALGNGQRRLLDSRRRVDYIFVIIIALIPIVLSLRFDIWNPTIDMAQGQHLGFNKAYNFWAHVLMLPLALYLLRDTYDLLFGDSQSRKNLLIKFKDKKVRDEIHEELKNAVLNPVLPFLVLCSDLIFHYFDLGEVVREYILGFLGKSFTAERSIYWGNLWVAHPDKIDITTNLLFTLLAYWGQFILLFIAITGIAILLMHNIFYLNRIFQRSRAETKGKGEEYFIVLDLEDGNRRFGLLELNPIFNRQLIILIVAGLLCLVSRLTIVSQDKLFHIVIPSNLTLFEIFSANTPSLRNFLPEFGQWAIVLAWLIAFVIVLIPSLVKFLPIFSKMKPPDRLSIGIVEYLREFIPPTKDDDHRVQTPTEIKHVARLFAGNSFWPIGDEGARFLFWFVFVVAFSVLFPPKWEFSAIALILIFGFVLGYLTFRIYKWVLGNVDSRLVRTDFNGDTVVNTINTGGGAYVKGNVTSGGDFAGRDSSTNANKE